MKSLSELNQCTDQSFEDFVKESICRSQRFASMLRCARPFGSADALHAAAKTIWLEQCGPVEWLDALAAHPRLGDRRTSGTAEGGEQRAVLDSMDDARAVRLAELNERYEQRFGYTFLLCAPGVPAHVVEERILSRLNNSHVQELLVVATEHSKINEGRLNKLLHLTLPGQTEMKSRDATSLVSTAAMEQQLSPSASRTKPPVTTHILDISQGRPASGVVVAMSKLDGIGSWIPLGCGATDDDGRCMTLVDIAHELTPGQYKLTFSTGEYLQRTTGAPAFYPEATVAFTVLPSQVHEHFHIPLLLSPFGFSTYRGS